MDMRRLLLATVVLALSAAAFSQRPESANVDLWSAAIADTGGAANKTLDLSLIDKAVDPCVDFSASTCNKWRAVNSIAPDRSSWGRGSYLQDPNPEVLHGILEAVSKPGAK